MLVTEYNVRLFCLPPEYMSIIQIPIDKPGLCVLAGHLSTFVGVAHQACYFVLGMGVNEGIKSIPAYIPSRTKSE